MLGFETLIGKAPCLVNHRSPDRRGVARITEARIILEQDSDDRELLIARRF